MRRNQVETTRPPAAGGLEGPVLRRPKPLPRCGRRGGRPERRRGLSRDPPGKERPARAPLRRAGRGPGAGAEAGGCGRGGQAGHARGLPPRSGLFGPKPSPGAPGNENGPAASLHRGRRLGRLPPCGGPRRSWLSASAPRRCSGRQAPRRRGVFACVRDERGVTPETWGFPRSLRLFVVAFFPVGPAVPFRGPNARPSRDGRSSPVKQGLRAPLPPGARRRIAAPALPRRGAPGEGAGKGGACAFRRHPFSPLFAPARARRRIPGLNPGRNRARPGPGPRQDTPPVSRMRSDIGLSTSPRAAAPARKSCTSWVPDFSRIPSKL